MMQKMYEKYYLILGDEEIEIPIDKNMTTCKMVEIVNNEFKKRNLRHTAFSDENGNFIYNYKAQNTEQVK